MENLEDQPEELGSKSIDDGLNKEKEEIKKSKKLKEDDCSNKDRD